MTVAADATEDLRGGGVAKYCDLIMKGGITSGVVYPKAVSELSKTYHFKNIGGTSAGAIAAAGAAAAEYGRLNGKTDSFEKLEGLPNDLVSSTGRRKETLLAGLFQAGPRTAGLEKTIKGIKAAAQQETGKIRKGLGFAAAPIPAFPHYSIPGAAIGLLVFGSLLFALSVLAKSSEVSGWMITTVPVALVALVSVVVPLLIMCAASWWGAKRSLFKDLPANYLGIALGHSQIPNPKRPALTDWLDRVLQDLSGKGERQGEPACTEQPLTFGDLWAGASEPSPAARGRLDSPPPERAINLEIISTCLTLATPYRVPFEMKRFFFSPKEFRELFPHYIVEHMIRTGNAQAERDHHRGSPCIDNEQLVAWPDPADIPVLVAARMSLSFPLLISAIPLWAADYTWKQNKAAEHKDKAKLQLERCWFSDGGISSNFPIHLFDAPLPRWPTFGLNLRDFHPSTVPNAEDQSRNIAVMTDYGSQDADAIWRRIDVPSEKVELPLEAPVRGQPTLGKFAGVIVDAMKHWQDDALSRAPGYRDRIAHVLHTDDEGGMNLEMDETRIRALADRGKAAAAGLAAHFNSPFDVSQPKAVCWDNHRWVRYRSAMAALEQLAENLERGYSASPKDGGVTYEQLIAREAIPNGLHQWNEEQRLFAPRQMVAIVELVAEWLTAIETDTPPSKKSFRHKSPKPMPEMRVRPRF